jgi:hypothetical protein
MSPLGAHFNPAVTLIFAARGATPRRDMGKPRLHRGKPDRTPDRRLTIGRAVVIRYDQLAETFPAS